MFLNVSEGALAFKLISENMGAGLKKSMAGFCVSLRTQERHSRARGNLTTLVWC